MPNHFFDLTGKVAIVTGSSRGIGRSIAEGMAGAGAKVVVSSRKADKCAEVAQAISDAGGEAIVQPANVSDRSQLETLVQTAVDKWGRLDIVVGNAASNPYYGPILDTPEDAWTKTMDNNVRSNLWLGQLAFPHMEAAGGGSFIVISSIAAIRATGVLGIYGVSKAADIMLVRNLALEWGPKNIRVNAILPGLVKTDFARALWEDPERVKRIENQTPLRRIGDPDDIGGVAVFLASRAAAYITGTTIVADGGETT